ncbi:MAG: type restriction enzyme subunit [Bacteroidetes bacterium]|nr:type restriction enzyme subunit [Bacteroidota bacterium]
MEQIPTWIKPFDKIFEQLTYRWDHLQIFDDFLSIAVSNFQLVPTEGLAERMRKTYNEQELKLFAELFHTWVMCTHDAIASDDWIYKDLLGNYYQYLSGKYHKSKLGQFFTPEHLVDCMAAMVIDDETDKVQTVSDPCAGSGRMLLSAHMRLKGKMLAYAEDLDGMCCKICVLNFLIHGLEGEVIHHDALRANHWIQGWKVNAYRKYAVFNIQPISQGESDVMRYRDAEAIKPPEPATLFNQATEEPVIFF